MIDLFSKSHLMQVHIINQAIEIKVESKIIVA